MEAGQPQSDLDESAGGEDPLFEMPDLAVETRIVDLATNIDHYLYGHTKASEAD